ncbi:MAG: zinc-ribbon domain-containing protein [Desulfobacterales bacterium]|nr:zinc-ribbon domain-containing protein [Desulfobacterales bacterium]
MGKFYVDENNQARIVCHKCGINKNLDVTKFKDTHKRLKAKCRCGEVFRLTLDFRRHYRKNVRLAGEYFVQEKDEKGEILIEDISMTGINFATLKPHNFSKDDTVELKFTFNHPMRTRVQESVKIIRIIDRNVGAQYINQSRMQRIWFFV